MTPLPAEATVLERLPLRQAGDAAVAVNTPAEHESSAHLRPPTGAYVTILKPALERIFAAIVLLLMAPLLAVAAVAVAVSLGRPVLFRQTRVGLGGRTFEILKLRTMLPDRRERPRSIYDGIDRRQTHKSPDDPRVTGVGAFLRHWSIDELPQLWNVVRGDMALIGPRPELPHIVADHYGPVDHDRHLVRPGITGLWQITERGSGDMHLHVGVDLAYVEQVSPRLDATILLRTPLAALGLRRGY